MRHIIRTLILVLPVVLAAAASCTEHLPEVNQANGNADAVYLKIGSVTTSGLTKSAIQGTSFPTAEATGIGLFLVGDGDNRICCRGSNDDCSILRFYSCSR